MQEFNFEELDIEKELEETEVDLESENALEEFLKSINVKNARDIPALKKTSERTKKILKNYCTRGNTQLRRNRVIEFYKCLDWLPFDQLDLSLLNKFDDSDRKILLKEIKIYLNRKEERQQRASNYRKEYQKRIMQHFKDKVPGHIKQELEKLRDYELNLIGHDRNWQYYFHFKSFKKIDEFVNLTPAERLSIFKDFKKDVWSYKNNRDINLSWKEDYIKPCHKHWDDDIVKSINWEETKKQYNHRNKHTRKDIERDITLDYSILGVSVGADLDTIKKKYRQLAKLYHPDRPEGNENKMKEIISAYQRLIKQGNK
jgi:hypothetical protein